MKKALLIIFMLPGITYADKTLKTTGQEEKIIEMRIMDSSIWIQKVWDEKVSNTKEWLIRNEVEYCIKNNIPIPQTNEAILQQALTRDNRKTREKKERNVQ